jgi:hypothetical protein
MHRRREQTGAAESDSGCGGTGTAGADTGTQAAGVPMAERRLQRARPMEHVMHWRGVASANSMRTPERIAGVGSSDTVGILPSLDLSAEPTAVRLLDAAAGSIAEGSESSGHRCEVVPTCEHAAPSARPTGWRDSCTGAAADCLLRTLGRQRGSNIESRPCAMGSAVIRGGRQHPRIRCGRPRRCSRTRLRGGA